VHRLPREHHGVRLLRVSGHASARRRSAWHDHHSGAVALVDDQTHRHCGGSTPPTVKDAELPVAGLPHDRRLNKMMGHLRAPIYLIANGLIGEPTPPVTVSGCAAMKNSYTPSAAQSSARVSMSHISPM
jgi:hypothetical protein